MLTRGTVTATAEELAGFQAMVASFKTYAPHWDGAPITPETSARLVLGIVERATIKDTGAFLSHWGNQTFL